MRKVSIIIGCYNVAYWLQEKRLSCILNQTYRNLEVLLVNDGSTDKTPSLCQELAQTDNRIRVLSQENQGLGAARNTGLDHATGDYVWFYDVDDEAEANLIEKNVGWMEANQTEMNVFSYWAITPSQELRQEVRLNEMLMTDNGQLKSVFVDNLLLVPNGNGFAWNKFYRRSFIEEHRLRFGHQRIQQDELFNSRFYPHLSRVFVSSELLYHYYIYNTGNTRSRFIPDRYGIYLSIYHGLNDFAAAWELEDKRMADYTNKKLYAGINSSILFNTFHKDAPYSLQQRKAVTEAILSKEETAECLGRINPKALPIELRLYYHAYRHKSFYTIYLLHLLSDFLRECKNRTSKRQQT